MPELNNKQLETAAIIVRVGHDVGATEEQITAALSGAWVESRLGVSDGGDNGTAWGPFQQRPIAGWGSKQQVQDTYYAARAFFTGVNTNAGLLDIWRNNRTPGLNVQAVQRSAHPYRYDAAMNVARNVFSKLKSLVTGEEPNVSAPPDYIFPSTKVPNVSPPPDYKIPSTSNVKSNNTQVQRILVLSIGLVLILLALGNISSGR